MALSVPSYPNPYDPSTPIANAYALIAGLYLDMSNSTGRVVLNINPSETAWAAAPLAQAAVSLGETLVPGDPAVSPPVAPVVFPTLAEMMADTEFAAAFNTIGSKIYQRVQALVPAFKGSTLV